MQKIEFKTTDKILLDQYLKAELPAVLSQYELSNSKIRRLIIVGAVSVNGKQIFRPSFELRGTSLVQIKFDKEKFFFEKQPDDIKFEMTEKNVLFEDDNLIFVNKPAFFPVEQTITGNRANLHDALVDYLWKKNPSLKNPPYVGIMHRLDRDTSGIILFTKNRAVNKEIQQMFENHDFIKEYFALVCIDGCDRTGKNATQLPDSFTVEKYMGRISPKSQAGKWGSLPQSRGGLYSKTDFTVIKECLVEGKKCVLIKCSLYTGRTHQIRVHLSEMGFPILGDRLYGGKSAQRLYLHSARLSAPEKFDVFCKPDWGEIN